MSLQAVLRMVVEVLEESRVPYMLTGSLAGAYYALPRATQDADFVIDAPQSRLEAVLDGLEARGFYVSREAAEEACAMRGQFNAIDAERGWKVDLIFRKNRPFSEEEFARRRPASVLGIMLSLPTLEDLILAKLEWSRLGDSELQQRDVLQLVESAWPGLDLPYIEHWAEELGLRAAWAAILERRSLSQKGS